MTRKVGILPNTVTRNPGSEVAFVFITLAAGLDLAAVQTWLKLLGDAVAKLEAPVKRQQSASAIVGLGGGLFARFPDLVANNPWGLRQPPALQGEVLVPDVVIQLTYLAESRKAEFLTELWRSRPTLATIEVEQGYTRPDKREVFGQLDGLRNLTSAERAAHTKIDLDVLPEEPAWLVGGCYGAFMKIEQSIDTWTGLDAATREQIIGRREADGSRLDLPPGTNPHAEGDFADLNTPPIKSHVRSVGPRAASNDAVRLFRRGAPYLEETNGAIQAGLLFASYQTSLDDFDLVLNGWMLNPNFPASGAGQDALMTHALVAFIRSCVYVVPPADDRFPGAGYFDPPKPPKPPKKARKSMVHIRKTTVDSAGMPARAESGGIEFTLVDATTQQVIGTPVTTNATGRAVLTGGKIGQQVIVRETAVPGKFNPPVDQTLTLTEKNHIVRFINQLTPGATAYP